MKSPDEIKKGLEYCQTSMTTKYKVCSKCAYFDDGYECENVLREDVLAYIQQLEREKEELVKNKLLSEGISLDLREVVKVCEGELLVAAINMISDMQAAAPKWISVEERLPEDQQRVLCVVKDMWGTEVMEGQYSAILNRIIPYDEDYGLDEVTYWMKLPKAPEEDA